MTTTTTLDAPARARLAPPAPKADLAEIRRALELLAVPGGIVEIRALGVPAGRGKPVVVAGYFSDLDEAAQAAAALDARKPAGIYIPLNELNSALLARAPNLLTENPKATASDGDIIRRRWLPIDVDPTRPAGIASTEDEHVLAEDTARACAAWLAGQGWPEPIQADSGNGAHLLYRIDLPNDEASRNLVRDILGALASRFDRPEVKIDQGVFNPSRIWKCYGSVARKGFDTPDRPHRLARLVNVPERVEVVPVALLQAVAATGAKPTPSAPSTTGNGQYSRLDVPRWLADRGRGFKVKERPDRYDRTIYLLDTCPFDSGHGKGGEVSVMQGPDGKMAAGCFHNSCAGRGWQEFKAAIGRPDDGHYDPPLHGGNGKTTCGKVATSDRGQVCVVSRTFDEIKPEKIQWLWPGKIPLGKYTEIIGNPGVGKSLMTVDLMARVSRGFPCPDSSTLMGPGGVVLLSSEDDASDTIAPRLIAAGADLKRIRLVEGVNDARDGGFRAISLDRDVPSIEQALEATPDCKLLVIDPILAYSGKVDSHKAAEVRALLVPLTAMAQKRGLAVVGVTHFNKGGNGGPAIGRGMGSLAWVAAARMAWGVVKSADDPTVRLLLPIKANLAADATGLSYRIMDVDGVPVAAWSTDAITTSADDALATQGGRQQSPKRRDVKAWLLAKLNGGTLPANDILHDGEDAGFAEKLLRWAKKELGVGSFQEGFGRNAVWFWSAPDA